MLARQQVDPRASGGGSTEGVWVHQTCSGPPRDRDVGGPGQGWGPGQSRGTGQGWGPGQARGTGQGWGTGQARGPGQGWGTGLAGSGWAWARTCPLQRGRPALPEASAYFRSISDQGSGLGPAWLTSPCPVPALTTSSHQARPVGPGPCPHSGRAPAQGHPPCAGWRPSHH